MDYDKRIEALEREVKRLGSMTGVNGVKVDSRPGGIVIIGAGQAAGKGAAGQVESELIEVVTDVTYNTTTHELALTKRSARVIKRDLTAESGEVITTAVPLPGT